MDESEETINRIVLDLSLATALPISVDGRSFISAAAAASALGSITSTMKKNEIRKFAFTIEPLLTLLKIDIDNPVAAKAAFGLKNLMASKDCINELLSKDGLNDVSRILDIVLVKKSSELKTHSEFRSVVENLAVCYREISVHYPWEVVKAGALRHCILLLRYGDASLQTIA
jgi:hypothetical protein